MRFASVLSCAAAFFLLALPLRAAIPDTPLFVKTHDFLLWLIRHTQRFPKNLRHIPHAAAFESFNRDQKEIPESRRTPTLSGISGGERASAPWHALPFGVC